MRLSSRRTLRAFSLFLVFSSLVLFLLEGCDGGGGTEPDPVPTTVTVSPSSMTLDAFGAIGQFSAMVRDEDGEVMHGASVIWHTGNPSVASIDSVGFATAVGIGTVIVTATSGSASATATLTVDQVVNSVTVTPATATLAGPEKTLQFSAEARDGNSYLVEGVDFTWSSSDPACVHVDATGLAMSGVEGQATITATGGGTSGTAELTVLPPPVATVEVTPSGGSILAGGTVQLAAILRDESGAVLSGREIVWTSQDPLIASVDQDGLVTGVLPGGPVSITASSEGKTGDSQVTVLEFLTVTSLVGDKDGFGLDLEPGDERPAAGSWFDSREPDDPSFSDVLPAPFDFSYTHGLQVPEGGEVSSARIRWLTLAVKDGDSQVVGDDTDIVVALDGIEVPGAFDSVDQFRHNGTTWVGVVGLVEIPLNGQILDVLQDGEVEVRIQILQLGTAGRNTVSFDFSELEVVFQ
jgi:uncharacterized protein YjdB